jgi:hypothetical protein
MQEEKTPWWMWPLFPLWLLVQVVSFLFVIAFTVWRILLALTIPVIVIAVIVVLVTGGGDSASPPSSSSPPTPKEGAALEAAFVGLYCVYGSVSEVQYDGCLQHVSLEEVLHRHTDAAEYAMGNRTTCGYDAGPGCAPRDVILERMGIQKP